MAEVEIRVSGARSHNLKNISCRFPVGKLTVVTGVSGSGKSTLVFETLYAESQRRYVASLSTYARQFLERLARPDVDLVSNVPPAIFLEHKNRTTNARSTVGTATELLDYLRLLFAKIGQTFCPDCKTPVVLGTVESVTTHILERWDGARIYLSVALKCRKGEKVADFRARLMRDGFVRLLDATQRIVDLAETNAREFAELRENGLLLIDRLQVDAATNRTRLAEAVALAFEQGEGVLVVVPADTGERTTFRSGFVCDSCARTFLAPTPALFSFNSPLGACEACQGFGRTSAIDYERVVPDPRKTLREHAIVIFATKTTRGVYRDLLNACRDLEIPTDLPFEALSPKQRELIFEGDGGEWYGVRGFFEYLERKKYKVQNRVMIARYRKFETCRTCQGQRLRPEAFAVLLDGKTIGEISAWTLEQFSQWLAVLALDSAQQARAGILLRELRARAATAVHVGLGYLGIGRQMRTLSGGEAQRVQLSKALGGALTSSLYLLDEPSIGLHARDVARLLETIRGIRDQGNTVVMVEHAPELIEAADHIIDLGPGAGRLGGEIMAQGTVSEVRANPKSKTGAVLRTGYTLKRSRNFSPCGELVVVGARANNLKNLTVRIPLGQLVVVTGVSGAGKSSLVNSVLVGGLQRRSDRGACDEIRGAERVSEVVVVDAASLARSPRSNPATISKAFDGIRRRFAATPAATRMGVEAGWFSFNRPGGRCEACEGTGEITVDMQFLDDVRVLCEQCDGTRYRREARAIALHQHNIVELLALTLEEACEVFRGDASIAGKLKPFVDVGLGYLQLGQPLSTLSSGEAQRLRLGLALTEGKSRTLYVLDEPTTGLHPSDIQVLLHCFDSLLAMGASVLVVEHNLELIRSADHLIDLGPEGGPGGGNLIAAGTPSEIAATQESITGAALRA